MCKSKDRADGAMTTVPAGVIAIAVTGMVTAAGIAAAIGMTDGGTTVAIIIVAMAA
ncbi:MULTISPECIES: hypothetical protein [unclassified Rhizobium]|uniref:hypothetical protein n=1 Tax=unclassified Rhizobium TaxID=2613769 RepID=UPI001619DE30|nr:MULTISPECIES: hypothetical protein [unclassified Rhizobium]MBB3382365.1 hypothetical protein [Rhizobium sp. BK098]MBB3614066.1 hypothetical protein [Rhizobium sp. BK609]MBB3680548.1 hypothetical protein [Rhizobium sp. BK612]